jgi:RNA polymerase sigma-70 factor (ECF subfamily)
MTPIPADTRSDQELVAAINEGDLDAFETLYRRYRDWVVGLAHRFLRDRDLALDVLQETFSYVLGKCPGLELTARMTTFLYPVVKNLSIRHREKARRSLGDAGDEVLARLPDRKPVDEHRSLHLEDLRAVVDGLPEAQQEVVLMRFVDGMKLEEIAAALSVPLGTVKSRLHNALHALREDGRTRRYFDR